MTSSTTEPPLDDYLGLLTRPLNRLRMLVFHGESGAGKSSQIALLLQRHPQLQGRQTLTLAPEHIVPPGNDVLVIEELRSQADCAVLSPALAACRLLLVASHVEPRRLWRWRWRVAHRCYALDRQTHKLARWLQQRSIRYSPQLLAQFCRLYGANFTDLEIVLRHTAGSGADDFDQAWQRFARQAQIVRG